MSASTPSEKDKIEARKILNDLHGWCAQMVSVPCIDSDIEAIATALAQSREDEREEAVNEVLNYETDSWNRGMLERIAEAIRSRGGK